MRDDSPNNSLSNNLKKQKKQPATPDYLKRTGGVILTCVSTIGLIFASPLVLVGGLTGWLTGLFTTNNPLETSFKGAKIGSLGTINAILFGLELTQATIEVSDISEQELPLNAHSEEPDSDTYEESIEEQTESPTVQPKDELRIIKPQEEPLVVKPEENPILARHSVSENATQITRASTVPNIFFSETEKKPETSKTSATHYFEHPEHIETFMVEVNALIAQNEAQAELKEEENLSKVAEQEITALVEVIKNSTRAQNEFWNRLVPLSQQEIKLFVKRLNPIKTTRYSSSELDDLWRCFRGFESEPSKREFQSKKFAVMLEALSEEQLKASFESPDFLNILNKDSYITAAANTLSRKQLELFASNSKVHDILNAMIKKLKPGPYTLGKLVSILPFATRKVREALIDQLAHLPCPASFNIKLTQLADHYIKINNQIAIKQAKASKSCTTTHLTRSHTVPSKWNIPVPSKPVYRPLVVLKKEWSDQALDALIADLNARDYITKTDKLFEDLNSLPDQQIKIIVERASSPDFKNLLPHLWQIDSKTTNHLSSIENRSNRLKVVLETLSEEQLKSSLKENKFWEIFRNTQEPYAKMAAEVLSPQQFATISAHASIDRHTDFAVLITQISKDNPAEKRRLHQILEAIIPHTTPWVVLTLERQIKNLLPYDQDVYHRLNHDLKKYLRESLERPEVSLSYKRDRNLDKKAISLLLVDVEFSHSPSLTI
ncbi:hypothetical protein OQJ18_00060 [Fluoribacter dumoffii]|uniref:hypothetical protein n=1 Tax=Fluoribacter dumoffii TaxID=463 RepID=UPI002242E291|nr:hypothetical protein [Fluoribacter dumoffii]MCW8419492.1 hypothetical protein [Fluoribacter dumoffii]MCW8452633.1 hypothetical protein [Fluoribacter dumoffii]MCW8460116.1 hypothetical protein [Fluoribacter dumoffii]MCW8483595.1 hypothetical protein [Fluoribacter dumoffii]